MDPYKILKIDKTASNDEIKKQYLKMANDTHPDHGGNADLFNAVSTAYNEIINPNIQSYQNIFLMMR